MDTRITGAVAASAALVGVLVGAPAASAEPDPPHCPRGNVRGFSSGDRTDGPVAVKSAGNWQGAYRTGTLVNLVWHGNATDDRGRPASPRRPRHHREQDGTCPGDPDWAPEVRRRPSPWPAPHGLQDLRPPQAPRAFPRI